MIFQHLQESERLIIELLYIGGLRIAEALRLRVQDIDNASKLGQSLTVEAV